MGRESKENVRLDQIQALRELIASSLADIDLVIDRCKQMEVTEIQVRQMPKGRSSIESLCAFTGVLKSSLSKEVLNPISKIPAVEAARMAAEPHTNYEPRQGSKRKGKSE